MELKINRVQKELDLFRQQIKKERNELDLSQFVKETDLHEQLEFLKHTGGMKGGTETSLGLK